MPEAEAPPTKPQRSYFDLEPKEIPLSRLRQLVVHWVLPFNNLYLLCSALGINAFVAAVADLATPRVHLFPWLTSVTCLSTLLCLTLQIGLRPAWTSIARKHAVGRFFLRPATGGISATLLLLSVSGAAWAQAHPDSRGALASHSATLQSLQDSLLGLSANVEAVKQGVEAANEKLDQLRVAQADARVEEFSRRDRAASRPEALGLMSLSLLPAAPPTPGMLHLHLAVYLNAPGIQLSQARLQLQTRDHGADPWATRDLSEALSGGAEQKTLQFDVRDSIGEICLCLAAPYPDAAHPHAVRNVYRLRRDLGDQALQPASPAELIASDDAPCKPSPKN